LTVFLGALAGMVGGSLGTSGSGTMLPGMLILGIVPNYKTAAGTVLLTLLPPLSLLAIYEYYKRRQIQFTTSFILMISYFFASYLGGYLVSSIPNRSIESVSGFYFIMIGCFFLWNARYGSFGKTKNDEIKIIP
jgi:uncharacterized membrane protein YfcA